MGKHFAAMQLLAAILMQNSNKKCVLNVPEIWRQVSCFLGDLLFTKCLNVFNLYNLMAECLLLSGLISETSW